MHCSARHGACAVSVGTMITLPCYFISCSDRSLLGRDRWSRRAEQPRSARHGACAVSVGTTITPPCYFIRCSHRSCASGGTVTFFASFFGPGLMWAKIRNQKSLMMTVPTRRLARIAAEILFAAQGGSIAGCWRQKDCSEKPEIASNILLY